jgi:hypothetical protein
MMITRQGIVSRIYDHVSPHKIQLYKVLILRKDGLPAVRPTLHLGTVRLQQNHTELAPTSLEVTGMTERSRNG